MYENRSRKSETLKSAVVKKNFSDSTWDNGTYNGISKLRLSSCVEDGQAKSHAIFHTQTTKSVLRISQFGFYRMYVCFGVWREPAINCHPIL